jgi:hypothetical protein
LFLFGEAAKKIFTCLVGDLSLKYLGFRIDKKIIRNKHWKPPEEKMERKCGTWQGIPMYFYGLLVGLNTRMDFFLARLLCQQNIDKNKYHLVKWLEVCKPKDMGES